MEWFAAKGASIYYPLGHSPDVDFVADFGDRLVRVQVKTCICFRNKRWEVTLATRGGNQSWNGVVKLLDATRCDYLVVIVGDGRRWCIPSPALGGGSKIVLGGPKYSEFEVEPGRPLPGRDAEESASTIDSPTTGGMSERPKESGCKPDG